MTATTVPPAVTAVRTGDGTAGGLGGTAGTTRRISAAVFCGGVATFASLHSTQALLPLLGADFRIGAGAAMTSMSAATAGMAVGLLGSGTLSDRVGRTQLMRWSLVLAAVLGVLVALAPTWPGLLGLRVAQGMALSFYPAAAAAYLREEVDRDSHARVSGLYIGGTAIGGMLGRLVAGLGAEYGGWRAGLACVAVLAAAGATASWALLPASRGFTPVLAATAPSFRHRTGRLFRDPALVTLWLVGGLVMGTFTAVFNAVGYRLTAAPYRLSVAVVGFVFLVYAVGSLASALAGRAAGRWGRARVTPVGAALLVLGIWTTAARPLPLVIAGLVVVSCGFFVVHGVVSGWVAALAQPYRATGQASAVYLVVYYVGSSVCGPQAGHAWTTAGWDGVALLTGGLSVATLLLTVGLAVARSSSDPDLRSRPGTY